MVNIHASDAGSSGSVPDPGAMMPHVSKWLKSENFKNKEINKLGTSPAIILHLNTLFVFIEPNYFLCIYLPLDYLCFPLNDKLLKRKESSLFSPSWITSPQQCLAYSQHSTNMCWINQLDFHNSAVIAILKIKKLRFLEVRWLACC